MECLDGRERTVLKLRYGIEGERLTFTEIGHRLGLTRERASEIARRSTIYPQAQRHLHGSRRAAPISKAVTTYPRRRAPGLETPMEWSVGGLVRDSSDSCPSGQLPDVGLDVRADKTRSRPRSALAFGPFICTILEATGTPTIAILPNRRWAGAVC